MTSRLVSAAVVLPLTLLMICGTAASATSTSAPSSQPSANQADTRKLVEQLGANSFAARERAQKELVRIGLPVKDQVQAIAQNGTPEQRRRAQKVLLELAAEIMRSRVLWSLEGDFPESLVSQDSQVVILHQRSGELLALDLADGKSKWKADRSISSAASVACMGKMAYATVDPGIYGFRISDGQPVWAIDPRLTPKAGGSMRFVFAGENRVVVCNNYEIIALEEDGNTAWCVPTGAIEIDKRFFVGTGAAAQGVLYLPISSAANWPLKNRLLAIDLESGKVLWTEDSPQGPVCCSPVVSQGVVYYATGPAVSKNRNITNCTMYARDAKTGKLKWERTDNGVIDSRWVSYRGQGSDQQPAVVGDKVIFGIGGRLFAMAKADGKGVWTATIPLERNVTGRMMIAENTGLRAVGDTIYFGSDDGVYAYDARNGTKLWRFDTSRPVKKELAVQGDRLVFVLTGGNPRPGMPDSTPAGVYVLKLDAEKVQK